MNLENFFIENWQDHINELEKIVPFRLLTELTLGVDPIFPGWHPKIGWFVAYCGEAIELLWTENTTIGF